MRPLLSNIDVLFHLAADPRLQISVEFPLVTNETNITGTITLLQLAKEAKVKKIIFSSSCAIYGDQTLPIKENACPMPKSPYGLQKLTGEQYVRLFHDLYGLNTLSLRYFNVYGRRKTADGGYPMVIPIFLKQRQEGLNLTIVGDGEQTRDYVHVSDVVEANLKAWRSSVADGGSINIGSGRQTSVNEIAELVGGAVVNLNGRHGEMRYIEADIAKAYELLGWRPLIALETGIAELKNISY